MDKEEIREALTRLFEELSEIKDNHLKHIDLRLSNLEKGQSSLEKGQLAIKNKLDKLIDRK